ncbi:MAG TPA: peptidylprolyl isomerase [Pseudogracilibacillus sp.]|nr:peptidylprolyl isomerase [Pseudogracilibacillus sp.]
MRKYIVSLFIVALVFLTACGTSDGTKLPKFEETDAVPVVTMTMENGGEVVMELYPNIARNTVNNFISLVQDGFYDGLTFHRVIPDFMIQGGDPEGVGIGGPGYSIVGEFESNGYKNDLKHERGVLSMARSNDPDSAGSQFFIMVADSPHLDGDYAAFGKVIDGMDVVDEIVNVETNSHAQPLEDQVIESMTVELNGYEFEEPIIIEE